MGYVWFLCYSEKPDICRCIHSSHNRLGFLPRFTFFFMNEGIRIRRAKCFLCTYLISGFGTMFEQCNTWSKCSSIIHTVSGTKFFLSIKFVRIYSKNILLGSGYRGVGPTWPQLLPGDLWTGVRAPRGDSQGGEQGEEEERPGNTMHHRSSRPSP